MKLLNVLCFIGLLVSLGAGVYSSRTYILHSLILPAAEANAQISDVMLPKIEALLKDFDGRQIILDELKFRRDLNKSYLETMQKLSAGGKDRALIDVIAWISVAIIFFILQLLLYAHLRPGRADKERP